jgi:hypothetical protein
MSCLLRCPRAQLAAWCRRRCGAGVAGCWQSAWLAGWLQCYVGTSAAPSCCSPPGGDVVCVGRPRPDLPSQPKVGDLDNVLGHQQVLCSPSAAAWQSDWCAALSQVATCCGTAQQQLASSTMDACLDVALHHAPSLAACQCRGPSMAAADMACSHACAGRPPGFMSLLTWHAVSHVAPAHLASCPCGSSLPCVCRPGPGRSGSTSCGCAAPGSTCPCP